MAVTQARGAVDRASLDDWLHAIDAHPAWRRDGPADNDFNPHSSSLRACAVQGLDLAAIAAALAAGELGDASRRLVGAKLACDLDRCWVRRQYAPSRAPAGHAAHSWHQDGALGFDFLGAASPAGELLSMATCWIALTPCGLDAPGLEFVDADGGALVSLADLADSSMRARHRKSEFLRPALEAGDALVFGGGVLHHTHVDPSMTNDRTSLELRFFAAESLPARLRGDRFLALH